MKSMKQMKAEAQKWAKENILNEDVKFRIHEYKDFARVCVEVWSDRYHNWTNIHTVYSK